jgi:hypothetical protein
LPAALRIERANAPGSDLYIVIKSDNAISWIKKRIKVIAALAVDVGALLWRRVVVHFLMRVSGNPLPLLATGQDHVQCRAGERAKSPLGSMLSKKA